MSNDNGSIERAEAVAQSRVDISIAKAQFIYACSEWADGLIEDGVRIRKAGGTHGLAESAKMIPKVAYTSSPYEGTTEIRVTDLPELQLNVWRAGLQLIQDAFDATPAPPYEPPPELIEVDLVTFDRDHAGCWQQRYVGRGRIECTEHRVFVQFRVEST